MKILAKGRKELNRTSYRRTYPDLSKEPERQMQAKTIFKQQGGGERIDVYQVYHDTGRTGLMVAMDGLPVDKLKVVSLRKIPQPVTYVGETN